MADEVRISLNLDGVGRLAVMTKSRRKLWHLCDLLSIGGVVQRSSARLGAVGAGAAWLVVMRLSVVVVELW